MLLNECKIRSISLRIIVYVLTGQSASFWGRYTSIKQCVWTSWPCQCHQRTRPTQFRGEILYKAGTLGFAFESWSFWVRFVWN